MNTSHVLRVVFKGLSKVITRLRCYAWWLLKSLAPVFYPKRSKTNRTLCTRDFPHAFSKLQLISRNFDWFIALPAPVLIGRNYYLGIGFSTVIWKPLQWLRVENCTQLTCLRKRNSVSQSKLPSARAVWTSCYKWLKCLQRAQMFQQRECHLLSNDKARSALSGDSGPSPRTTATATTTPENNDLISWTRKNNRAARAARTLVRFFDVVCQTKTWHFQT